MWLIKTIKVEFVDATRQGITVPTYSGEFSSGP